MAVESNTIATGLLIAALAAVPLASIAMNDTSPQASDTTTTTTMPSTTVTQSVTRVTTPPPEIEGLSEPIVRVLVSNGFAAEEQTDDLPSSVSRILADNGIALTIAEEG